MSRGEFFIDRPSIVIDGSDNAFDVTRYFHCEIFICNRTKLSEHFLHLRRFVTHGRSRQRPPFTTPGKFKNVALFLRLGLPSTLIRHENGAFRKRSSNRRVNLKRAAFRFREDGKHFENRTFRQRWRRNNLAISLTEFS